MLNSFLRKSDGIGALASTICLVHCLLTPFLFAVKACHVDGCCAEAPLWWKAIDVLFLGVSLWAVIESFKEAVLEWIKFALVFVWCCLAFIIINEYLALINLPSFAIYIPALALIALHFYNRKTCNCCTQIEN